ncbi:MAG TPA: tetratricopeptide repeat protein, partial [Desulfosalsimonadaceae bacterium]|nr:tetratricopeptide repeat protein [Desulfosalsimonadaceae bacterium]
MAGSASKKNRTKRKKNKQSSYRRQSANEARREKGEFYFEYALYYTESGNTEKAETFLKKAIKLDPDNRDALILLARLGEETEKPELVKDGFLQLYERQLLENITCENDWSLLLCQHLLHFKEFQRAKTIAEQLWAQRKTLKLDNPKKFERELGEIIAYSTAKLDAAQQQSAKSNQRQRASKPEKITGRKPAGASKGAGKPKQGPKRAAEKQAEPEASTATEKPAEKPSIPEIPVTLEIGENGIAGALEKAVPASAKHYELVMDAVQLRFQETFDHLLCLNTLQGIDFLAYQEETARKVLKRFRGRALLADEVGMGKTIEACMVLKEYIMRRMIRNALVLAPTPLVSQWQEELRSKFGLQFVSTDDRNPRGADDDFWQQPFIVASINIAKSKKNFGAVSGRD